MTPLPRPRPAGAARRRRGVLRILAALPLASVAMVPLGAMAAFSDRPITLVVPFPAGGAADIMARTLALQLGAVLGQQVIVATGAAEAAAWLPNSWPAPNPTA